MSAVSSERVEPRSAGMVRLLVAGLQAGLLYGLIASATGVPGWPASVPLLFVPLLVAAVFVPILAIVGIGRLPGLPLTLWIGAVAGVSVALGLHDVTRDAFDGGGAPGARWPSPQLVAGWGALLFVANVLATEVIAERRLVPSYARYFDTSWKQAVQFASALAFVGVFWGVLALGAGLFAVIGIAGFGTVITKLWFAVPATTLSFATALHVTDVNPGLIRGIRSLALTLLSWLLPLVAGIGLAFLASLPFTGIEALWRTRFAAKLLLAMAGLLIVFVNTAHRFDVEPRAARVKTGSMRIGALELAPIVALAAWALAARVAQYGWTVGRVLAVAATALAACYAFGYALAAIARSGSLKRLETTNLVAAYLLVLLGLALLSPVADPARLMVAGQMARLRAGAVTPEGFDVAALRVQGARWGREALAALSTRPDGPGAETIRSRAAAALDASSPYAVAPPAKAGVTRETIQARIKVVPDGRPLPEPFLDPAFWARVTPVTPYCLRDGPAPCTARFLALRPGAPDSLVLLDDGVLSVFDEAQDGTWTKAARVDGLPFCPGAKQAFETGGVASQPHPWQDIVVAGQAYPVTPTSTPCPK